MQFDLDKARITVGNLTFINTVSATITIDEPQGPPPPDIDTEMTLRGTVTVCSH